mgnify:FL=1
MILFSIAPTTSKILEKKVSVWGAVMTKIETRDTTLMNRICKVYIHGRKSPLCDNRDLYNSWKKIFESKWVSRSIALGIMYAESHIGANYAWSCNSSWNNWGGIKRRITDDWKSVRDQKIPNWWCRLYKFKSVEDYFNSKANTLVKYKSCFNRDKPIQCISKTYLTWCKECRSKRVATIAY